MSTPGINTFIADTDALIALINKNDSLYKRAVAGAASIAQMSGGIIFPATTIAEAITTCRRKYDSPELAVFIKEHYLNGTYTVVPVDDQMLDKAMELYDENGSKQNTFFDAVVAAVAKEYHATAVFSYDPWYRKVGLKLLDDIL